MSTGPATPESAIAKARALLRADGAVADALGVARAHAATAADSLSDLSGTAPAVGMAATAHYLVDRVEAAA